MISARHVMYRVLNPRLLSQMTSYVVASTVSLALMPGSAASAVSSMVRSLLSLLGLFFSNRLKHVG
jgi:hypothetical protein